MKRFAALILIFTMILGTGCSGNSIFNGNVTNWMKEVEKQEVSVTNLNVKKTAREMTDFSIDLFRQSFDAEKNTLISPLSVISALSMTGNGAKGKTLNQMEEMFGLTIEELNAFMYMYMQGLSDKERGNLNLANAIWLKEEESFVPDENFLQTNANYYGADIFQEGFDKGTVRNINNWVAKKTDDMIPEILNEIPEDAIMYLVNALAFEAEWEEIYRDSQVWDEVFTLESGEKKQVSFMHSEEYDYLENEYGTGVLKYYKGLKYAFAALLPKEGMSIEEYVSGLEGEELYQMLEHPVDVKVETAIPKFEGEFDVEMNEILGSLGMTDAFDSDLADFSGMGTSDSGNLYISRVLHKTRVSVAEKGTKAGAVTVIEVTESAAMLEEEPKVVILDRPFVYMLVDCENNLPFFIGTMMDVE